jgi:two-component sensor histidine kinase
MPLRLVPPQVPSSSAFDAAAEANHRIANNLSMIASLIRMRGSSVGKDARRMRGDEVRLILEELGGRLDTVAGLHRLLASRQGEARIDIAVYLRDVAEALVSSLAPAGAFELQLTSDPGCFVTPETALALGLIAGELLTNAVKYAHPTGVAGQIRLACHRRSDGNIALELSDDGVGLPEGVDPMQSGRLGFRLVRSLADRLGATIAFHSDDLGLDFALQVPACSRPEQEVVQC